MRGTGRRPLAVDGRDALGVGDLLYAAGDLRVAPPVSGMGFAFKNEQAARVVLKRVAAEGATVEDEVREAMANGGLYINSVADESREIRWVFYGVR